MLEQIGADDALRRRSSPSENRAVAVTISGGKRWRVATCAAAVAAFSLLPRHAVQRLSVLQLAGSAGLMLTASQKGIDGPRRIAQRHVAMAALLDTGG